MHFELRNLDFCFIYLDGIQVAFGTSRQWPNSQHCKVKIFTVHFERLSITNDGIQPDPDKVQTFPSFPLTKTVKIYCRSMHKDSLEAVWSLETVQRFETTRKQLVALPHRKSPTNSPLGTYASYAISHRTFNMCALKTT